MRKSKGVEHVLDQAGSRLGHPCDLDLLRFFQRHPRALLTTEQLAAWVGYDVQQVSRSLDSLIGAGLVTRSPTPKCSARMYVLTSGGTHGGWLKSLLEVADARRTPSIAPGSRGAALAGGGRPEAGGKLGAVRAGRSGRVRQEAT